jgi:class 3 adenylate cyclase
MDVRTWLEGLGLGRYAEAFEANAIDLDTLPHISDDDLKDLGIPLGHRRKLQAAIASLPETEAEKPAPAAPQAERRQITVMFCDLVGSTALAETLDPEDLRSLMQAYQQACGAVIERYDGHVAQYLGDGLMTYFGWPTAHEDDAERAVRAGLEIVKAVKKVDAPEPLGVRIGVATGPVVVGETGAGDASVPKLAVGETPNLAARVQGLAGPDEIVVAPSTRRLVGGAFEVDDLGEHTLKGVVEPVRAWRVTGLGHAEGRFEAAHVGGLTPLVGREIEIAMVMERWSQAKEGEGQVVLLCGEPGIGKSRITQVLRERVADEPHIRLRYQCSPYYTNTAFYPLIQHLERAAGFSHDDPTDVKLDKLKTLLAQGTEAVAEAAPLFAAVLSIPTEGRYAPLELSPQRQKEKTIEAMANQVVGLSKEQTVLLILEDAHWIDPTTLEMFGETIARIGSARVLLVITYRPEFAPPWLGHAFVTVHTLNRLSRRHGAAMVEEVAGGKPLPAEVLDQIVAKTDGVPLFVEELTKTVIESGFLRETDDRYELDGPLPRLAIPATLHDSLMARLDRLAPVKEIAQIGATIGREFSYELLAEVSPLRGNDLHEALNRLVGSELVFRRGQPPDATYVFKNALIQDVAYDSLLKSRRQQLHTDIAQALEERLANIAGNAPELLAHHYTEAGLPEQAVAYWLKAGHRAINRSAYIEAIAHLQKGLELLSDLPETPDRDQREVDLRVAVGVALIATKGYAAPETGEAYTRARELCARLDDPPQIFQVLYGLWVFYLNTRTFYDACDLAQ